ncbi:MAG TPA: hypothetical protein VE200_10475 [Xanthobacteraceae bacterium]|jgi:hypothetical protein|nr:hypothetical protein [Xanthobacteraceae bacterium]
MVIDVESFAVAGVVVGGERKRVQLADRDALALYLHDLPEGTQVNISITADSTPPPRVQQRRYWWGVVMPICATHFQTTPRQMSRDLLSERFGFEWSAFGQDVPAKPSLSWLSADEMSALLEWVRGPFADAQGLEIPVPDKDWRKGKA